MAIEQVLFTALVAMVCQQRCVPVKVVLLSMLALTPPCSPYCRRRAAKEACGSKAAPITLCMLRGSPHFCTVLEYSIDVQWIGWLRAAHPEAGRGRAVQVDRLSKSPGCNPVLA